MIKSIHGKLISGFLITIIGSFLLASYIYFCFNSEIMHSRVRHEIVSINQYIGTLIKNIDATAWDETITSYVHSNGISVSIFDGTTYHSYGKQNSLPNKEDMEYMYKNPTKKLSRRGKYESYGNLVRMDDTSYYIYTQKDSSFDKRPYASSAFLIFGCVFLLGSIIFLAIADIIVKPIATLTNATKELSKGNYNVRVNYFGDDEISRLNQSFNQMAQQLAKHEMVRQRFISDISHEFQTPLTAIQGFAKILKEEELPEKQCQKYADIILFHSKRLSNLSKNMLQLTVLENEDIQLDYTNYSIISQLSRVISMHEKQAEEKQIQICFVMPKKDIYITADEQRMEQVWINLINNAIKYTNPNGKIWIRIKKVSKEIEVQIKDTGPGMSQEVQSHIFERFYREDMSRSIEGNGLGLSIVKSIIDLHAGQIDIQSMIDKGSTFIVRVPISGIKDVISRKE